METQNKLTKKHAAKIAIEKAEGGFIVTEKGMPTVVLTRWKQLIFHLVDRIDGDESLIQKINEVF